MAHQPLSRRDFIKATALGGIAATLPLKGRAASPKPQDARLAANLVFMVADGMDHGTLAAANHYLNLTEQRDSEWMRLYREGVARRAVVETWSASSIVTDSAAASSAWGCGQRVNNRSINTAAGGDPLPPLYGFARTAGLRTGLVTTTRVTHATPAGFAANVRHRDMEDAIARQYLDRRVDVVLGGGSSHFDPRKRKDQADLAGDFSKAGYSVVRDRAALEALSGRFAPTLGLFSPSHMPYSVDMAANADLRSRTPSLTEMTARALRLLSDGGSRFALQVEGGRVDHGAHANDPAALLYDQLEFDRCIALVRTFAEKRGDTLVIITTDHGTGGFMLNGYGPEYEQSRDQFLNIRGMTTSFERLLDDLPDHVTAEIVHDAIRSGLGLDLKPAHLTAVMKGFANEHPSADGSYPKTKVNLGELLRPALYDHLAVMWTSQNHTADLAELATFGPGSSLIPAWVRNYEIHAHVRAALGM